MSRDSFTREGRSRRGLLRRLGTGIAGVGTVGIAGCTGEFGVGSGIDEGADGDAIATRSRNRSDVEFQAVEAPRNASVPEEGTDGSLTGSALSGPPNWVSFSHRVEWQTWFDPDEALPIRDWKPDYFYIHNDSEFGDDFDGQYKGMLIDPTPAHEDTFAPAKIVSQGTVYGRQMNATSPEAFTVHIGGYQPSLVPELQIEGDHDTLSGHVLHVDKRWELSIGKIQ